jgi:hypothetical protein
MSFILAITETILQITPKKAPNLLLIMVFVVEESIKTFRSIEHFTWFLIPNILINRCFCLTKQSTLDLNLRI